MNSKQKPFIKKRVTPPHQRRELYYRRKYRRRRRYWQNPRTRYRRVRSHNFIPTHREDNYEKVEGRGARQDEGRSFVRNFRNLFGAPEHCLEEGRQYSCTFAPVCWLTGGVATPGRWTWWTGQPWMWSDTLTPWWCGIITVLTLTMCGCITCTCEQIRSRADSGFIIQSQLGGFSGFLNLMVCLTLCIWTFL